MLFLMELVEHQAHKLFTQGKRWTEVQILKAKLHGLNIGRKAYLGMVLLMFFAMVMALSFGASLLIGAYQLERFGGLYWNWPLGTSVVVFAVSMLIFIISSREKAWLSASGLKKSVKELYGPYHSEEMLRQGVPAQPAIDLAGLQYEMRRSVDETVQRRMREEIHGLRDELRSMLQDGGRRGGGTEGPTTRVTETPSAREESITTRVKTSSVHDAPSEAPKSFAVEEKRSKAVNDEVDTHVTTKVKGNPPPIH